MAVPCMLCHILLAILIMHVIYNAGTPMGNWLTQGKHISVDWASYMGTLFKVKVNVANMSGPEITILAYHSHMRARRRLWFSLTKYSSPPVLLKNKCVCSAFKLKYILTPARTQKRCPVQTTTFADVFKATGSIHLQTFTMHNNAPQTTIKLKIFYSSTPDTPLSVENIFQRDNVCDI